MDSSATSLGGYSVGVSVARQGGTHWRGNLAVAATSPAFEVNDLGFQTRTDRRDAQANLSYVENAPGRFLRNYAIQGTTRFEHNYDGERIQAFSALTLNLRTLGFWNGAVQVQRQFRSWDDRNTRGGPLKERPAGWNAFGHFGSDTRKPFQVVTRAFGAKDVYGSWNAGTEVLALVRAPRWNLSLGPSLTRSYEQAQYLTTIRDAKATDTYGAYYLFAPLRQTTVVMETRLDFTFTPKLSFQLYAQPFISSGDYGRAGSLKAPRTQAFVYWPGPLPNFDFNYRSLRGTAVLRWEYRPGSTLYLAWQQTREDYAQGVGDFDFGRDRQALFRARPDNVFVLKASILADLLDQTHDFPGVAAPREAAAWASFCPDPNLLLRLPLETTWREPAGLPERRARLLGPNLSLSYREPIHVVRGRGTHLYDALGREYLDCVNNVAHVGHEHPRVVAAGRRQMGVLNTNTRYLHESVLEYAERLGALLPQPLSVCLFVNSGSEANELALRMARAVTGGRGVVALEGGYHGNTQGLIDVSHYKFAHAGGQGPPPWVRAAPLPDDFRGRYRRGDPERAAHFAAPVAEAFADLAAAGHRPAAFFAESILSCGGQVEPPAGYFTAAYAHAHAAGALCIADEVQVGFGRVGEAIWGFDLHGVVPDIVTLGKPIGNGHPMGAVVTTPEIARAFANGMEFFSTFGGNPVSAAIGLAVLDVLRDEGLQDRAREVGNHLRAGLAALMDRHATVGDVRGRGLFLGVEIVSEREGPTPSRRAARYVVERAKDKGILLSTDGPDDNVLKIKPPLVFSRADADRVVAALDEVLGEDGARG